jgi:hypothetical protein
MGAALINHKDSLLYSLTDIDALLDTWGLLEGATRTSKGRNIVCPFHADTAPSCSVWLDDKGLFAFYCHGCTKGGDVFAFIASLNGLDTRDQFKEVLIEAARAANEPDILDQLEGRAVPHRTAHSSPAVKRERPPVQEKGYPPQEEVQAFFAGCVDVHKDQRAARWIEGRGLDPGTFKDWPSPLARVLKVQTSGSPDCPPWADYWGGAGYRLIIPMYDYKGRLRSVRARNIEGRDPKAVPPKGFTVKGLVMADYNGLDLLKTGKRPKAWNEINVVITEGEPDFFTRCYKRIPYTVNMGIVAGSWTADIAARIPTGAKVYIRTDDNTAGHKYADKIEETLRDRCKIYRRKRGNQ